METAPSGLPSSMVITADSLSWPLLATVSGPRLGCWLVTRFAGASPPVTWPLLPIVASAALVMPSPGPPVTLHYLTSAAVFPTSTSSPHPLFSVVPPASERCAPAAFQASQPGP